jgi:hypothetical protein
MDPITQELRNTCPQTEPPPIISQGLDFLSLAFTLYDPQSLANPQNLPQPLATSHNILLLGFVMQMPPQSLGSPGLHSHSDSPHVLQRKLPVICLYQDTLHEG